MQLASHSHTTTSPLLLKILLKVQLLPYRPSVNFHLFHQICQTMNSPGLVITTSPSTNLKSSLLNSASLILTSTEAACYQPPSKENPMAWEFIAASHKAWHSTESTSQMIALGSCSSCTPQSLIRSPSPTVPGVTSHISLSTC